MRKKTQTIVTRRYVVHTAYTIFKNKRTRSKLKMFFTLYELLISRFKREVGLEKFLNCDKTFSITYFPWNILFILFNFICWQFEITKVPSNFLTRGFLQFRKCLLLITRLLFILNKCIVNKCVAVLKYIY